MTKQINFFSNKIFSFGCLINVFVFINEISKMYLSIILKLNINNVQTYSSLVQYMNKLMEIDTLLRSHHINKSLIQKFYL